VGGHWAVADFDPARDGFHFSNAFASAPLETVSLPVLGTVRMGDAANGLCGGMAFAVRDLFEAGQRPPLDRDPPAAGSAAFRYVSQRLIDSLLLPDGPLRYYTWMALPDEDSVALKGVATRSRLEASLLRQELASGQLCCLGLIRVHSENPRQVGYNHQVLAWAYDQDASTGRDTVHLYDPNHPGGDTTFSFVAAASIPLDMLYATGEPTRGFFVTPYSGVDPAAFFASNPAPDSFLRLAWRILTEAVRRWTGGEGTR
jgi:hypothetical protein